MIIMNQHDKFKQPMAMSLMLRTMITDESAQNTKISDILNRPKLYHLYMYSGIIRISYDFLQIARCFIF